MNEEYRDASRINYPSTFWAGLPHNKMLPKEAEGEKRCFRLFLYNTSWLPPFLYFPWAHSNIEPEGR